MHLDTAQVVQQHLDALMSRDVDRIMADYAEDAFFITNLAPGAVCGTAALRQFWAQSLTIFTPEVLASIKISKLDVERDVAYLVWSAGTVIPFASDTLIVRHGKIAAQTGTVQIAVPQ